MKKVFKTVTIISLSLIVLISIASCSNIKNALGNYAVSEESEIQSSQNNTIFTITFLDQDKNKILQESLNENEQITFDDNLPEKEGFGFVGWQNLDGNIFNVGELPLATKGESFSPVFKKYYSLTLINGNETIYDEKITEGTKLSNLDITTPIFSGNDETKIFAGWSLNDSANVSELPLLMPSKNLTFNAVFAKTYKITFKSDDKDTNSNFNKTIIFKTGEQIVAPDDLKSDILEEYGISCWYNDLGIKIDLNNLPTASKDETFTAKVERFYNLTLKDKTNDIVLFTSAGAAGTFINYGDFSSKMLDVEQNDPIKYVQFNFWETADLTYTNVALPKVYFKEDKTLYANVTEKEYLTVTIYETKDSTVPYDTLKFKENETMTIPESDKEYFENNTLETQALKGFDITSVEKEFDDIIDEEEFNITKNYMVVPVYANAYIVNFSFFVTDEIEKIFATIKVAENEKITKNITIPEKVGYTFYRWEEKDNPAFYSYDLKDFPIIVQDTTYIAVYKAHKYNWQIVTENNKIYSEGKANYNETIDFSFDETTLSTGEIFVGYDIDGDGKADVFTNNFTITEDVIFVVVTRRQDLEVTFKDENGNIIDTINYKYGDTTEFESTKDNYIFIGWIINDALPVKSFIVTKDSTVVASYTPMEYDIVYYKTSLLKEIISTKTASYGTSIVLSDVESKTGQDFMGWTTSQDSQPKFSEIVTGAENLYPVYKNKVYTIVFENEDKTEFDTNKIEYNEKIFCGTKFPLENNTYLAGWKKVSNGILYAEDQLPLATNDDYYIAVIGNLTVLNKDIDGNKTAKELEGKSYFRNETINENTYNCIYIEITGENLGLNKYYDLTSDLTDHFTEYGITSPITTQKAARKYVRVGSDDLPEITGKVFTGFDVATSFIQFGDGEKIYFSNLINTMNEDGTIRVSCNQTNFGKITICLNKAIKRYYTEQSCFKNIIYINETFLPLFFRVLAD